MPKIGFFSARAFLMISCNGVSIAGSPGPLEMKMPSNSRPAAMKS